MTNLGPYELLEQLGEGGMGQVWGARDHHLDRDVAVKLITGGRASQPEYRARFRAEVQSMARLDHRGIVEVFDYASLDANAAAALQAPIGAPYYVMERASGALLDAPPRSWSDVHALLNDVLDALAHSHSRGVIHRDLKPGNILVCGAERQYKLADFGIAYHSHHWPKDLEGGGAEPREGVGSPYYMAPEQWLGQWRDYGPWSDLYALGCVAFELLCGRPPFDGDSLMALAIAHTNETGPVFEPQTPVPDGLGDWIDFILARDPLQRFRRAADAAWALNRLPPIGTDATLPLIRFMPEGTRVVPTQTVPLGDFVDVTSESPCVEPNTAPMVPGPLDEWRGAETQHRSRQRGIGLFGLRAPTMVDRDAERSLLWDAVCQAAQSGRPQGLILEGPAGIGKSRLAQWLCERAEEVGGAKSLRVAHAPGGQFADGIGPMLDTAFSSHGLDGEELHARLRRALRTASPSPAYADVLAEDADVLAELIRPAEHSTDITRAQSHTTLMRLLKTIGARRALVFWVDDGQWAYETLSLVEALLQHQRRLPLLIVLTVRADRASWSPNVAETLERLDALDTVRRLTIGPLEDHHQRALIDDLMPLTAEVAEQVTEHTHGEPLFAVQSLQCWVESDALTRGAEGYEPRAGVTLPVDVIDACGQRIEHLVRRFAADEQAEVRACLEVAAALGEHVDVTDWTTLCEEQSLHHCSRVLDHMLVMGIAHPQEGAWSFAHHTFRDVIDARTTPARRRAVHAHWAAFLERHDKRGRYGVPGRTASHWLKAGEHERAVEPLLEAARQHYERAEYLEALDALDRRGETLDRLEVPPADRRQVENFVLTIWYTLNRGDFPEDVDFESLLGAEEEAVSQGWFDLAGRLAHLQGYLGLVGGDATESDRHFERAAEHAIRADDEQLAGHAMRLRGYMKITAGQLDGAREFVTSALQLFQKNNDAAGTSESRRTLATIAIGAGDLEHAEQQLRTGLREVARTGYRDQRAMLLCDLGELESRLGRYDRAEQTLREAAQLFRYSGMPTFIADGNLGLALLAAGRPAEASESLQQGVDGGTAARAHKVVLTFQIGLDACTIRRTGKVSPGLNERLQTVAARDMFDHHLGWGLKLLIDAAAARDLAALVARATAAYELSVDERAM